MQRPRALLLALLCALSLVHAGLLYSGPEDLYAFPKYRTTFLNNLPVHNDTVQRWLRDGLQGGEREFLNQMWDASALYPQPQYKEIGSSELDAPNDASQISHSSISGYMLKHMKMGLHNEFICLIPPPRDTPMAPHENIDHDEILSKGWSLLEPLSGKCLYHRQPWFTYSYCHNQEIRQFKELTHTQPRPPGTYEPTEDPEWEAFTLGRSPSAQDPGADIATTDHHTQVTNLEVAHGPGSRYLVQQWGDGTFCDKTGKPREVEVQFHCSMTMTDSILLVREAKTCSYVLIIQTPHLCGEPGFKSRAELPEQAFIRCRQIVNSSFDSEATHLEQRNSDDHWIPEDFDQPLYVNHETRFAVPSPAARSSLGSAAGRSEDSLDGILKRTVEATVEALMNTPEFQSLSGENAHVMLGRGENGEVVIEILEEIPLGEEPGLPEGNMNNYADIAEFLRKAGYQLKDENEMEQEDGEGQGESKESHKRREEL